MNKKDITSALSFDETDRCCSDTACCPSQNPMTRVAPKIGRNDPCPLCNSGKKYKKCCGR